MILDNYNMDPQETFKSSDAENNQQNNTDLMNAKPESVIEVIR